MMHSPLMPDQAAHLARRGCHTIQHPIGEVFMPPVSTHRSSYCGARPVDASAISASPSPQQKESSPVSETDSSSQPGVWSLRCCSHNLFVRAFANPSEQRNKLAKALHSLCSAAADSCHFELQQQQELPADRSSSSADCLQLPRDSSAQ